MKDNLSIEVILQQKSLFEKPLPLEVLLGEELQYGSFEGLHLVLGKVNKQGFVAYHKDHLARGIRVTWQEEETKGIKCFLPIPTCEEEIHDLFQMVLRVLKYWTCSITMNGTLMTSNEFKNMEEETVLFNLRTLHEVSKEVLNEEKGILTLSCAMHRLCIGAKEADHFWSGTNTNEFRNWMHTLQALPAYVAEPQILSDEEDSFVAVYTIPSGVPLILTSKPELPLNYYDLKTGKPNITITSWNVRYYDPQSESVLGTASYKRFLESLPIEKTHDYDGGHIYVNELTRKELELLASLSDQHE